MTRPMLDLVMERLLHRVTTADALVHAFAEWLGVYDQGSSSIGSVAGLWAPRDVAVAGLREAAGKATPRPFTSGLDSLRSRVFFRPHIQPVFEGDPLAILAIAIGVRYVGDASAMKWIAEIATQSAVGETDLWRVSLLAGAVSAATGNSFQAAPELVVALATRGIGTVDLVTKQAAFDASIAIDDAPGERAAACLTVLSRPAIQSTAKVVAESSSPSYTRQDGPMKILLLAANPTTTDSLLLDEEARGIEEKIRLAEHRDAVQFVSKWAVRPDDLHTALLQYKPMIVHFSGHGAGQPGIVLHGAVPGTEYLVSGAALKHLFATLKGNIRVVVLNTCESLNQATTIAEVVDFVIGMDSSVGDETARRFAAAFYLGIASGQSIDTSFQLGISAVKLHGLPDDQAPRLCVRVGASAEEVLVKPRS